MTKHGSHSIEFKRQIAWEFRAGETLHALAKRHDCRSSGAASNSTSGAVVRHRLPLRAGPVVLW